LYFTCVASRIALAKDYVIPVRRFNGLYKGNCTAQVSWALGSKGSWTGAACARKQRSTARTANRSHADHLDAL